MLALMKFGYLTPLRPGGGREFTGGPSGLVDV